MSHLNKRERDFLQAVLQVDPSRDPGKVFYLIEEHRKVPGEAPEMDLDAMVPTDEMSPEAAAEGLINHFVFSKLPDEFQRHGIQRDLQDLRERFWEFQEEELQHELHVLEFKVKEFPDLSGSLRRLQRVFSMASEFRELRADPGVRQEFARVLLETTLLSSRDRPRRRAEFEREILSRGKGHLFSDSRKTVKRIRRRYRNVAALENEWLSRIEMLRPRGKEEPAAFKKVIWVIGGMYLVARLVRFLLGLFSE